MIIGAQFWTLRDYCRTLNDFSETLKKVADIGYTTIQVSGTCAYEPQWLSSELKKNGLTCNITHYDVDKIIHNTEDVASRHKVFDCHCIGYGGKHQRPDGYNEMINALPVPTQKLFALGHQFTYHHHAWEYQERLQDGRNVMQFLSDSFTPEQMNFTLDTYWVKYGGEDVINEIKRLSGRMECVHLKDMLIMPDGERRMAFVGGGNSMDFEKIIQAFSDAGTKYALVEQDECYGADPFEELTKSFKYLKSLGLCK